MLRSRAKWVEEGEKNTSFFLKLETRNQKLKCITKLKVGDRYVTGRKEILEEERQFYQTLYARRDHVDGDGVTEDMFLNNTEIPKLSENQKEKCDLDVTLTEYSEALKELPNGKSPGCDGLPAEFYKMFWGDIKDLVFSSYIYSLQRGELSIDQRRGVITLIPKQGKDLRTLGNWRPITLLNTDYKILAKVLANRIQTVISDLISTDQTGYVKGRFIGDNIRTIADLLEYSRKGDITGIIALLDFQKAFDSISWQFLYHSLQRFNFGKTFINWIKALYASSNSCTINNGHASAFFPVERGVRQGCPVSPLLFIIVAEVLACRIRSDKEIRGIEVGQEILKITQLADDTTLFVRDENSLKRAMYILEQFSHVSGLVLNQSKTQAICLSETLVPLPNLNISWIKGDFKTLGIWFSSEPRRMAEMNFSVCLDKIKTLLNIWRQRDLSLKGRITVLKSLAVSKLVYICSVLYVPPWFVQAAEKLFTDFLWGGKPAKVKKKTIIGATEDGGLKMPKVDIIVKSLKLSWLRRLLNDSIVGSWKCLSWKLFGDCSKEHIVSKMKLSCFDTGKMGEFQKQVVDMWYQTYSVAPCGQNQILRERLWMNCFILVNNKPLRGGYELWKDNGIIHIKDIVNEDLSCFLKPLELENKYSITVDLMRYNSLISAIPREWKTTVFLKEKSFIRAVGETDALVPLLPFKDTFLSILGFTNKLFSRLLVEREFVQPTALAKWTSIHPELSNANWRQIFTHPYVIVKSTKIQSFQYKILNRIFVCGTNLFRWKLVDTELCSACVVPETLEHYFYECRVTYTFWSRLQQWIKSTMNVGIKLNILDILLGILNENNDDFLFAMNYCILNAKWYIFKERLANRSVSFIGYLEYLKNCLIIERYILDLEGGEEKRKKWSLLLDAFML